MAQKTISARVQVKRDTQTNWNKATGFVPLDGELIYYKDLNDIKIGNGSQAVTALDFVDFNDRFLTLATLPRYHGEVDS